MCGSKKNTDPKIEGMVVRDATVKIDTHMIESRKKGKDEKWVNYRKIGELPTKTAKHSL